MEKTNPGNDNMPDFEKLSDRVIVEPTDSPFLVMKTNLDPKDVTEDNPYFQIESKKETKKFKEYFDQE
ncbi:hypothetical protein DS745_19950 [Anaerobacillus alkaliphilus]|uniref:Uncharacterized protein n=1 Tax=Anaerobacillus alkaliphilus TaxID=1548597 RepID=A0A4Q0VQ19_9BACI|nr:hypothetical protein [Anaerobacillus alkaliphilus]RXI98592.1 hypothetical protein DS745_19950 [Anaerobacillus alkaliphilus]